MFRSSPCPPAVLRALRVSAVTVAPTPDEIAALLRDPAVKLWWDPERAELADSRDLDYTYGYWRLMRLATQADSQVVARGKYVTIWRRAPSGDWKVVLDIGNGVRD
ncbi:MAG TPA: hypothetical protein VFS11_02780 [Gemmatimonadales bacterium]|nr:hypothetical protein [Gemmatimonadales bacterium]